MAHDKRPWGLKINTLSHLRNVLDIDRMDRREEVAMRYNCTIKIPRSMRYWKAKDDEVEQRAKNV
ncbi:MAG TPA: hypothetical protein VFO46_02280 [Candidatus Sulfotelmatobacter sp.]|nr:hypothetical protein [Candidatus Sulfotelmatobacter sp.]